jgi:23S rRNA (cytosine1962-C5)-methyltransferase
LAERRGARRSPRQSAVAAAAANPVSRPCFGPRIVLGAGRDKSLRLRHPWIFSGAIDRVEGDPAPGDTVDVFGADGAWLACAGWSPSSQIRARVWSFVADTRIDAGFFATRVRAAVSLRSGLVNGTHDGVRLVHGESDGLPGVIADRYGDVVVLQCLSAGGERWRQAIADALAEVTAATCVFERSDAEVRALEGLPARVGPLRGTLPEAITIREDGLVYRIDPVRGQKTGFYLDQRDNRRLVRTHATGRRVLNAFCYTGGFTLAALAGGAASVVSIDSSAEALALARENLQRNPALPAACASWLEADVFADLRRLRNAGAAFDLIVLDPPKFAPTAAHAQRATRAYKDINLLALKMLAPGGLLATFSCSGGISADLFQKVLAGAALDAGVDAQILARLGPSADHPVALAFPEGDYLKGLLIRKA